MGAGQSTPSQNHPPTRALHVLRVTPSSPASQTTIEPFFDFIVGFEGNALSPSAHDHIDVAKLERIVESHENQRLNLLVWNSKTKTTRVVPIIPSRGWSSHTVSPNAREPETEPQPSLLGLSMRMCEPELSVENVWHVMDVLEGSPAESAGLVPYGDWIIGWSGGVLSAEGDFYDLVEAHVDKPLRVYVYSHDFDTIREVVLVPNRHWGGEGLLGCVFGFGLIHRIPTQPIDREPGTVPPELDEPLDEYEQQELFVPADVPEPREQPEEHAHAHAHTHASGDESRYHHHNGHAHDHSHDHEHHAHDHDHDHHDHDHADDHAEGNRTFTAAESRMRTSSWAASTPPRRPSLGPSINGAGIFGSRERDRTPVPTPSGARRREGERVEDDDEESVAETETTELGSERTSLGSLTSVD